MESKHTPEPWTVIADAVHWGTYTVIEALPDVTHAGDVATDKANAARIAACVNGCAGIADPSAVQDMLAAITWAMEMLVDSWGEEQLAAGDDQVYNVLARALAKAEGRL